MWGLQIKERGFLTTTDILGSDCVPQISISAIFSELEQELADYNGDDENEGEFEADKQAELAQI